MFDMQHVAKKISALRKDQNMTQMELADRLGISFQAVSNWERGQTMPDIAKLGELAGIFGVTIDELLGNAKHAQVVQKLIREEPVGEELTAGEFADLAPLLRPRQAEKLWENVHADVSLRELAEAAPFVSEGVVDDLAREAMKRERSFEPLVPLLPFMSRQAVDECVDMTQEEGLDIRKIAAAAPFLTQERLDGLADRALREAGIQELMTLAPFLDKEKLTEAAVRTIEEQGFSKVLPLLPFLDRSMLDEFFKDKWKGKGHE